MRASRQHIIGDSDSVHEITAAQLAAAHAGSRASVSPEQTAHFDEIEAAFATGGVAETAVQVAGKAAAAQKVSHMPMAKFRLAGWMRADAADPMADFFEPHLCRYFDYHGPMVSPCHALVGPPRHRSWGSDCLRRD